MKTITLINNKGGSGKTTTASLLAYAIYSVGQKVQLIDLDEQKTATQMIRSLKIENSDNPNYIIYDTPPDIAHPRIPLAIEKADLLIIPAKASPIDMWTSAKTFDLIRSKYPQKKVRLLFSEVEEGTILGSMLDDMASEVKMERFQSVIHKRSAYKLMALQGDKVFKNDIQKEIFKLATEINSI